MYFQSTPVGEIVTNPNSIIKTSDPTLENRERRKPLWPKRDDGSGECNS